MNVANTIPQINLNVSKNVTEKVSASQYALQVALQTMKGRCQKLQSRLSNLEDENLQLRLEKHKLSSAGKTETNVSTLEKKVAELSRQKMQLSHHILMVATENKELWERLSKLTEENACLGSTLINITDSLKQASPRTLKPDKSLNIVDSCVKTKDGKEHSMDEVSLKALNSLIKGRPENHSVHSEEMMQLQNGTVSLEKCGFTLGGENDAEDESLLLEMKELLEQMKNQKTIIKQQQESLKASLGTFEKIANDGLKCQKCSSASKDKESVPRTNTPVQMGSLSDRICPLCEKSYPITTSVSDFHKHVVDHFTADENVNDSLITQAGYEVIKICK